MSIRELFVLWCNCDEIIHRGGLSFQSSKLFCAEEIYDSRKSWSVQEGMMWEKIYLHSDYFYSIGGDKFIRRRVLSEAHKSAKLRERQWHYAGESALLSRDDRRRTMATAHRESVKLLEVGNALVARQSRFDVAKYAIRGRRANSTKRHGARRPVLSPSDFRKDRPGSSSTFSHFPLLTPYK